MTSLPSTDLRSQLRHAITNETDELVRCKLEFAVDGLDRAIRDFTTTPHGEHLSVLNGAWVNAMRTLDTADLQKASSGEIA